VLGKIWAFHSFRGGTGKSNITANIGHLLALRGKRVGIVDTDIQSPGIHLIFQQKDEDMKWALNDYLAGKCPIESAAYDVTNGSANGGKGRVFLVPSRMRMESIATILRNSYDVALLNDGFGQLIKKLKLDYLLLDTHPGIKEETLLAISVSHRLVVVMRPDEQDYLGAAITLEIARKLEVPRVSILMNKVLRHYDFKALKRQVEHTYSVPVEGILPNCDEMIELASSDLFCGRFPHHEITGTLNRVVEALI